ncbi:YlbL family protein [Candidatus Contubernalis alkaliaceticus]|uniref:YlbL family protein n=1 Tax=Candidatus Contubernalis alkaliaceticus TaxID=338645 RepID=UPI001F4C5093|nr:PDZ domain-containing protein [Candidatus Contubernalis alkalaceticus]UNC92761.1 PDZ domain-containing protein [Candidatus Contubernalis alkalaceticus]
MKGIKKFIIIAVILLAVNIFLQTNYVVFRPGSAENLKQIITVENGTDNSEEGSFFLVTVAQQPANLLFFMASLVAPSIEIYPAWRIHSPDIDLDEHYEIERQRMQDSQRQAKIVALRRLGYQVPITSEGALVMEVMEGSPLQNKIQPGDVIIQLNGEKIEMVEELVNKVQERPVGAEFNITFRRDKQVLTEAVSTVSHTEDDQKAAFRISIRNWYPDLPVNIDIGTGAIAGPSAGLMFVLEIINQLEPEDISQGKKIVGTGTINIQEEVGPIGGIKQKIAAAEAIGADFFLVPSENMQEAKEAARGIELIEVKTLQDALNFLESIQVNIGLSFEQEHLINVYQGALNIEKEWFLLSYTTTYSLGR